jgi:hypothetical protein
MNETAASSSARKGETAAQIIARLSVQCSGNPAIEELVRINEAIEEDRLASALRASKYPDLRGMGTSFEFRGSSGAGLMERAKDPSNTSNDTVQRVGLHGETDPDDDRASDRAQMAKIRSLPTADGIVALVDSTVRSSETVQALSVKNSENNGCTVGSLSPPESASHLASKDNFFAPPPPAYSVHEGNEPCTAPAPPSPVQERNGAATQDGPTELAEAPLAKLTLGYCRCDFFDNGPTRAAPATKSGRSRARYRVNAFLGASSRNCERFKIGFPSEARFFKRSVPGGHSSFYEKVWARFEELRQTVRNDRIPMDIKPILAHLKDKNNHVVPRAAAVLFKAEGEPADIVLFLDGSVFAFQLDRPAKGSAKCTALKSIGYWNPEK